MLRKIAVLASVVALAIFCVACFHSLASADQIAQPSYLPLAVGQSSPGTPVVVSAAPDYTFSTGNFVASIINWLWVAFGTVISGLVVAAIYKLLGYLGIQTTQQQRDQLQEIIANGLNKAAAQAQVAAQGQTQWDVKIKSQVVADTVKYAQAHGADTIKALGLDPKSGQAVEAIKARIETAIVDDNQPTNPNVQPGITASTTNGPVAGAARA